MSKHRKIELSREQRNELEQMIGSGQGSVRTQRRVRILLLSDSSHGTYHTGEAIAEALLCSQATVANIRRRFLDHGLQDALYERPRPGRVPKMTGEVEAKLIMLACSEPGEGISRWTLRLLAEKLVELGYVDYVSHVTVGEVLKKTRLNRGGSRAGA